MDQNSKWFLLSRTMVGLVMVLFGPYLAAHSISQGDLEQAVSSIFLAIGALLVVIGRLFAKKQLTVLPQISPAPALKMFLLPLTILVMAGMLLSGCVASNMTDLAHELSSDPRTSCVSVTTPYGGLAAAFANPTSQAGTKVSATGGACNVENVAAPAPVTPKS